MWFQLDEWKGATIRGIVFSLHQVGWVYDSWSIHTILSVDSDWSVETVDLLLVKVLSLNLLEVVRAKNTGNIIHKETSFNASPVLTSAPAAMFLGALLLLSAPVVVNSLHMSCINNTVESPLYSVIIQHRFKKEHSCPKPGFGMSMVQFKDSVERCLCDFTDGCVELPFQESLLKPVKLKFSEQVVWADERCCQELELCFLLGIEYLYLISQVVFSCLDFSQLIICLLQIIHIVSVAHLLIL